MIFLCLIVDFTSVVGEGDSISPDAVAMLGELRRLQENVEAIANGPRLLLTFVDFGPGGDGRRLFNELILAIGDQGELIEVGTGKPTASSICSRAAADNAILLTGPVGGSVQGVSVWSVGDQEKGVATLSDVPRRVQETMGLPVPRPMNPANRAGSVIAIPAVSPKLLLQAAYGDPQADWLTLDDVALVYCEDKAVEDVLVKVDGSSRVVTAARKSGLHIVRQPQGPALFNGRDHALVLIADGQAPPADALRWSAARHKKL